MGQTFEFNPMQFDVQTALDKMPIGWYKAVASKAELKETEAKDGIGLEVTWKVIDGPFKERVVKKWYNVRNPSALAVAIAQKEITSFCGSMGIWNSIQNTDQILNQPLQIKLTDKKDSDYNDVKGYKTINGDDPVKPGAGATSMASVPYAQVAAPATPAAPAVDPMQTALQQGWQQHPGFAGHLYKGSEVKTDDEVRAMYAAPPAPPVAAPPVPPPVAAPPAYTPPQQPGAAPAYPPVAPAAPATPAAPGAPVTWQAGPPAEPWKP
jgi:hypothetical protein